MKKRTRLAMSVPRTDELRMKMVEDGLYIIEQALDKLGYLNKGDVKQIIEDLKNGTASEFLATLNPKDAISLPALTRAEKSKIVEIGSGLYYLVEVQEMRLVGRASTIDGVQYAKGETYPGRIVCLEIETGDPVVFSFLEVKDKIKVPQFIREETMNMANESIDEWNDRVDSMDNAIGVTRIPFQLVWIEHKINNRLDVLKGQLTSTSGKIGNPRDAFPSYAEWEKYLENRLKTGDMPNQDIFDTVLFLYQSSPDMMIQKLDSGEINAPADVKELLKQIAIKSKSQMEIEQQKKEQDTIEREERQDEEWSDDLGVYQNKFKNLSLDDIPGSDYKKVDKYRNIDTMMASFKRQIEGIQNNIDDLTKVLATIQELKNYVVTLDKGTRTNANLSGPAGQPILAKISQSINDMKHFIKRYKGQVIDAESISNKLMGRQSTMGNALIVVELNRIIAILYKTLKYHNLSVPSLQPETTEEIASVMSSTIKNFYRNLRKQ